MTCNVTFVRYQISACVGLSSISQCVNLASILHCPNYHIVIRKSEGVYFWLHWVLAAPSWLSLVAMSGAYSLLQVPRLLAAVASSVAEHRL